MSDSLFTVKCWDKVLYDGDDEKEAMEATEKMTSTIRHYYNTGMFPVWVTPGDAER